ncbi:MAG: PEP-CTERM sorting domain-containing protein [Bryobacteraceae bacterium]
MKHLVGLCVLAILATVYSQPGQCQALSLESNSGGTYDYSIVLPPETAFSFQPEHEMILSGLSGVTDAEISTGLETDLCGTAVSSFTATSVTIENTGGGQCFVGPGGPFGTLEVDSSVTTPGTVNFAIDAPGSVINGTTQGPVSSPEPETGALLLAGAVALCIRRCLRRPA